MTADVDKTPAICLICNASIGVSTRKRCPIFKNNVTSSEQPVANILSVILGQDVRKEVIHSEIICNKCYKLCNEVDQLQERLTEIKMELNNYYQITLRKVRANKETTETPGRRLGQSRKNPPPENGATAATQDETVPEDDDPEEIKDEQSEDDILEMDDDVPKNDHEDIDDEEKETCDKPFYKKSQIPKPKVNDADFTNIIPQMIISRENKTYICIVCSADERVQGDAKTIISHMKETHNIRLYICDICDVCGMEFLNKTEMSQHIEEHIENDKEEYECDVCQRVFTNVRLFRVHKQMHFPQKNHVCEECGKVFRSRDMLDEHMNVHTGVRPYKCGECEKDFASKYSHKAHEKTHVGKPRPYKCFYCSKTFTTKSSVATHEKTHSALKNFPCTICGKSFSSGRNLEVHCIIHTGMKAFVCRMCGKAFARKAEIRDHERTHTGEKPYLCEFCGATFGKKSHLQSHKRATHDDKRYQCIECGKEYKRRRLLDYHIKAAHTGERPYKCQLCSATFIYPEHLKKHRRIHTGEKPYPCEVCGKAFKSWDNRNAHRFVHSHKKPYECSVCGVGFMRKHQLFNHMESQGHINDTIVVNRPLLTTDHELIAQQEQESCSEMIIANQENQVLKEEGSSSKMYTCTEEVGRLIIDGEGQFADGDASEIDGTMATIAEDLDGQHSLPFNMKKARVHKIPDS